MERKRPSSSKLSEKASLPKSSKKLSYTKSSKKHHSSKQKVEKSVKRTNSIGKKSRRRIINREDSSSDELTVERPKVVEEGSCLKKACEDERFMETSNYETAISKGCGKGSSNKRNIYSDDSLSLDLFGSHSSFSSSSDSDETKDDKRLKKQPSTPATPPSNSDLCESGSSSPFRFWGKNVVKPTEQSSQSQSNEPNTEISAKEVEGASTLYTPMEINKESINKDWENFKTRAAQRKLTNEQKRSKSDKQDNTCKKDLFNVESNENTPRQNFSSLTDINKRISERQLENSKDENHEQTDALQGNASRQNKPIGPSKEVLNKNWMKYIVSTSQTEIKIHKRCFMEESGKQYSDEESNENIVDKMLPPITHDNKETKKRRSDPSNALKENRF